MKGGRLLPFEEFKSASSRYSRRLAVAMVALLANAAGLSRSDFITAFLILPALAIFLGGLWI
jgi:hypothetical protein